MGGRDRRLCIRKKMNGLTFTSYLLIFAEVYRSRFFFLKYRLFRMNYFGMFANLHSKACFPYLFLKECFPLKNAGINAGQFQINKVCAVSPRYAWSHSSEGFFFR